MTERSNGTNENRRIGDLESPPDSGDGQESLPAIDAGRQSPVSHEAPPLDVDEREPASDQIGTPDVIELAESTPVAGAPAGDTPPGETGPSRTTDLEPNTEESGDAIPPEAQEVIDTRVDSGATAPLPTPPNVAPTAQDYVETADAVPAADATTEASSGAQPEGGSGATEHEAPAPGFLGGLAARLGVGGDRTQETATDAGTAAQAGGRGNPFDRVTQGLRSYLDPRLHMFSTVPHRWIAGAGLGLILVFLLINSGGLALIVLSSLAPLLILVTLTQHDVFEKESNLVVAGVVAVGAVAGIALATLAAWVQGEQWFDTGLLNYGAGGFGGRFAERAGSAPAVVWLLVGLAIPALALVTFGGVPIALRRWPQFRNEVMDGAILGGACAAGFSIGASIVYWWPMVGDAGPLTSISDWTISVLGVALLRPIVTTLCGTMIGAGVWRYMIRQSLVVVVPPAIGGIGGYLLLTFGSIQLQASGIWSEFLWTLLVLAAVFILYRKVLDQAVADDRRALGDEQSRIVCPACHKVTPAGQFCAHCGQALSLGSQVKEPATPQA
jgi:hypothetical protein